MNVDAFVSGFDGAMRDLAHTRAELIGEVDEDEAFELGRRAARYAIAPVLWRRAVGECHDTHTLCQLLGVSRQALSKRVKTGSLLGLPGHGTTQFPVWQFDPYLNEVRPVVQTIMRIFQGASAFAVASWASSPQPELDDITPIEWLAKGLPEDAIVVAARRTAQGLGQ